MDKKIFEIEYNGVVFLVQMDEKSGRILSAVSQVVSGCKGSGLNRIKL